MDTNCLVCEGAVRGELTCGRCGLECHFSCVIGCQVNNPRTRSTIQKGNFRCPICLVSRRDDLTISVMQRNQRLHRDNEINFALDPTTVDPTQQGGQDVEEEENVTVEGADVTPAVAAPPTSPQHRRDQPADTPQAGAGAHIGPQQGPNTDQPPVDFIPIHKECNVKGKKFLASLNNFLTVPQHATTVLLGDSLAHNINKRDVDPDSDTLRVRSVGGLCTVAAVQALRRVTRTHGRIKRVIWSLGTNDHLHQANHCHEERSRYFRALQTETSRVFPNASVHFVVPYIGMKHLQRKDINDIVKVVKLNCPKFKIHHPPSLKDKVDSQGVHPNREGRRVFTNFFRSRFFLKQKLFAKDAGKVKPGKSFAQAHIHNIPPTSASGAADTPSAVNGRSHRGVSYPAFHTSGELDNGNSHSLDSLLKDRLFEIFMGQNDTPRTNRPSWQQYRY